jgi:hypothetical protein
MRHHFTLPESVCVLPISTQLTRCSMLLRRVAFQVLVLVKDRHLWIALDQAVRMEAMEVKVCLLNMLLVKAQCLTLTSLKVRPYMRDHQVVALFKELSSEEMAVVLFGYLLLILQLSTQLRSLLEVKLENQLKVDTVQAAVPVEVSRSLRRISLVTLYSTSQVEMARFMGVEEVQVDASSPTCFKASTQQTLLNKV